MRILRHVTTAEQVGQRLDHLLCALAPEFTRSALQKAIREGRCRLDGLDATFPSIRLRAGQRLELDMPEPNAKLKAEEGDVDVLWQDKHLLVCNKPPGLTVHPCPSCPEHTLVQRLLNHIPQLGDMEGLRPGIVHRLDKDTSGLMLVALTEADKQTLSAAFAQRAIHKEYLALVQGRPADHGHCYESIGRNPATKVKMAVVPKSHGGREAHTEWFRLWTATDERFSLLALTLHTGRTHQIRVHMAHLGHPLLGDSLYAPQTVRNMAPRQMLHAWRIAFAHPVSNAAMHFQCPPPCDMRETALSCTRRMQRIVVTGNPGSGKSRLTQFLARHGAQQISADDVVAQLYAKGGAGAQWIGQLADGLLTEQGGVNKTALLDAMQKVPGLRHEVERIVHALTRQAIEHFWTQQEAAGAALAVAEVPLFFEAGWHTSFRPVPIVVGVRCPFSVRSARMQNSRNWSPEKIAALESWQWSEERKLAACDILVDNSGTEKDLDAQAHNLLLTLDKRRQTAEKTLRTALNAIWE
ncbi:MAG: dephospho-CoA kinase [Desulfovibrio sp.]|nr:dephospho-CoA kinase [Desulfovibrio sp.]